MNNQAGPSAPKKVIRHLANGRTKVIYRYPNGFESAQEEGSEQAFWLLVEKTEHGCWSWRGRTNSNHNTTDGKKYNYGTWRLSDGSETGAHRAAVYYLAGKRVPDDLDLTSLCGDELCVNPAHRGVVHKTERSERKGKAVPAIAHFSIANDTGKM